jgi:hypothetical protein
MKSNGNDERTLGMTSESRARDARAFRASLPWIHADLSFEKVGTALERRQRLGWLAFLFSWAI